MNRSGTGRRAPARRRTLGLAGAAAAAGLTVLWCFVVPEKAEATHGAQSFVIRWGHPASWACLAALGLLVAFDASHRARSAVGMASLVAYASFLGALVL